MKKNPCLPKCPKRSPTCHAECKNYLDFWHEGQEENKAQRKKAIARDYQTQNINHAIAKKLRKTKVTGVRHEQ